MASQRLSPGVLVAREEGGARESALALRERGHDAWPAPVSRIHFLPRALAPGGVQALVFTSRHGVKAFVAENAWRDIAAFAVGPATALALSAAGFSDVTMAAGEGMSLVSLLRARLSTVSGEVLHVGGEHLAVDIAAHMRQSGFRARHIAMYRAHALSALPAEALAQLRSDRIATILLYSASGARVLSALAETCACGPQARAAGALCISPSVEKAARNWGWTKTASSQEPNEASLFAMLDDTIRDDAG